ncbi:MAG: protein translocase subunit SecD [Bacteroidales bacterium]|nr:protein translocase subunit SecD [Bacteroidales bacterium]
MQNKGAIRLVAILLMLACFWQLSFTAVSRMHEKKAAAYAEEQVAAVADTLLAGMSDVEKEDYINAVRKSAEREYIDSISANTGVFSYKASKAKEINLGLDLKGGMNVMLQVQLEDLVKALADNSKDENFLAAVETAKVNSVTSRNDFITLFADAWKAQNNGRKLNEIFGTYEMRDKITGETSDEEVVKVLKAEAESAVSNSFQVLRNRIDRFGVTQPNIQKLGNSGRILVELPGVKEPERVRKLLQGTASLEFWPTYKCEEVIDFLSRADQVLAETTGEEHPLFSVLSPAVDQAGRPGPTACIGYANYADTAKINKMFATPEVANVLPAELLPMWSVKASEFSADGNIFELVAIKSTDREGKAPLDGGAITDARAQLSNTGRTEYEVSMTMNAEGSNVWARLTRDNIGRQVAIVLDGLVYSYPTVQSEISGGSSQITGRFGEEEAQDLANVLKSGKLPAPATIVQEQVVGPSLGSESINAGLISFALAFVLVLIYMILFYSGAGLVADLALLCNVVLLFGSLVSFGAVLTLPGIAGLVLTLGMAVDANVIIYERVKEEIRAGKGLSKAIADGYSNAYSAIIDGQVTTILTGLVLFFFGSGPVKGFATTLIIGIITSVLTSIFITRLIFDDRVSKGKNVTFTNKMTENFLQNTTVKFIEKRKITYIISGVLILASILSISIKGFTYGVDFTGGRSFVVKFDQPVQAEAVRSAVQDVFNAAADADETVKGASLEIKQFGADNQMKITTSYKYNIETSEVDNEVEAMLYEAVKGFYSEEPSFDGFRSTLDNPYGIISSDKVGATIANDIKRDAIISVILALLVIFAYIAVRFKNWTWGLGGVTSLAHTAIIVIGFFSFFSGILPFTLDVDSTFIAAILTIIGYAINDNVVIFDRIREYRINHPKADLKDNVNEALNSTLSRTMNTSLTTLVTMLAIAIFGGEVIRGLAVALILGIIIGTYASIFIGTPVMYDVTKAVEKKKAAKNE